MRTLEYYLSLPYRIEIIPDVEEGGYTARYPDLPGCITCADTLEILMRNAEDAKKNWLEAALEDGVDIAEPSAATDVSDYIPVPYPGTVLQEGVTSDYVRILQEYLSFIHETIPEIPAVRNTGYFGPLTRAAVTAFQRYSGLPENGAVGVVTWDAVSGLYSDLRFGYDKRPYQAPGYIIRSEV